MAIGVSARDSGATGSARNAPASRRSRMPMPPTSITSPSKWTTLASG